MDRLEAMFVFAAIVDGGSLSAAGRRLNVPLATVSRKLADLEAHLKTRLITRSTRRLVLTDAGRVYAADVQAVLQQLSASTQKTMAFASTDGLRAALLAAKSIAYADPARGATAGAHFATVLQALGLREQLAARITVLPFGVDVIEAVAAGRFELGISQSSEIVQHAGVRYVGALPAPYGLATRYQAAALKGRTNGAALLRYLAGPAGQAASRKSGFAAP